MGTSVVPLTGAQAQAQRQARLAELSGSTQSTQQNAATTNAPSPFLSSPIETNSYPGGSNYALNPAQFATPTAANSLAQQVGGTANAQSFVQGPYSAPPQEMISADGGTFNAGLLAQMVQRYGSLQAAMQALSTAGQTGASQVASQLGSAPITPQANGTYGVTPTPTAATTTPAQPANPVVPLASSATSQSAVTKAPTTGNVTMPTPGGYGSLAATDYSQTQPQTQNVTTQSSPIIKNPTARTGGTTGTGGGITFAPPAPLPPGSSSGYNGLPVYNPTGTTTLGSPSIPGTTYPTMPQATGRNQLGQSINFQQNLAVDSGQNLVNQSEAQAQTADQQAAYYQNSLAQAYAPLLAGQGGYTAAQAAQIQNESGQFGLNNLNPSSYLTNLAGNAGNINNAVGGETGAVNQALNQGASAVNATINPSQLQWTPQMTQALQNQAAQTAGAQTQATEQQIQNNAFAAGNVSPLAIQAAVNRAQQTGQIGAAQAMTQAQVQANQAQLGAAQTYANIASQNAQETAQRNAGAQLQLGAANVGAQTSLAGLGQQATGSQQSELASANQIQSGQAQTVANANLQAGQSARNNYLGTQSQQSQQTGLTAQNQAIGAFGSQVGGANQAAGIQVQKEAVDQSQNAASLIFGKDGMVVPLKRGGVQEGPVTAMVGEEPDPKSPSGYAPEAIVPLGPPRREALGAVHLPAAPRTPINLKPAAPPSAVHMPRFAAASGRLGTVRPVTPGIPPQALGRTMTRSGFQRILPQFDDGGVFDNGSTGPDLSGSPAPAPPVGTMADPNVNLPQPIATSVAQQAQNAPVPIPAMAPPPVGAPVNANVNLPQPIADRVAQQQQQQTQNARKPPTGWQRAAAIAAAVGAGRIAPGLAKQLMAYGVNGQPLTPANIASGAVSGIAGRRNPALGQLAGWGAGNAAGAATGTPGPKTYLPNGMPVYGEGGVVSMAGGGIIPTIGDAAAVALGLPPDAFDPGASVNRQQSPAAAAEQAALAQVPMPAPPNNLSTAINGGPTAPPPNIAQAAQNNYWQYGGEQRAWDNPAAPVPEKFGAGQGAAPSVSIPKIPSGGQQGQPQGGGPVGGGGVPTPPDQFPRTTPSTPPSTGMPPVIQTHNIPTTHTDNPQATNGPHFGFPTPVPIKPIPPAPVIPQPPTQQPPTIPTTPTTPTTGNTPQVTEQINYPGIPGSGGTLPPGTWGDPNGGNGEPVPIAPVGTNPPDQTEPGTTPTIGTQITYPDMPGAGGPLPPGTGPVPTQPDVGGVMPPDTPVPPDTNSPDQGGGGGGSQNAGGGSGDTGEGGEDPYGYNSGYYFGEGGKDGGVYVPVMDALKRKHAKPVHDRS